MIIGSEAASSVSSVFREETEPQKQVGDDDGGLRRGEAREKRRKTELATGSWIAVGRGVRQTTQQQQQVVGAAFFLFYSSSFLLSLHLIAR